MLLLDYLIFESMFDMYICMYVYSADFYQLQNDFKTSVLFCIAKLVLGKYINCFLL